MRLLACIRALLLSSSSLALTSAKIPFITIAVAFNLFLRLTAFYHQLLAFNRLEFEGTGNVVDVALRRLTFILALIQLISLIKESLLGNILSIIMLSILLALTISLLVWLNFNRTISMSNLRGMDFAQYSDADGHAIWNKHYGLPIMTTLPRSKSNMLYNGLSKSSTNDQSRYEIISETNTPHYRRHTYDIITPWGFETTPDPPKVVPLQALPSPRYPLESPRNPFESSFSYSPTNPRRP